MGTIANSRAIAFFTSVSFCSTILPWVQGASWLRVILISLDLLPLLLVILTPLRPLIFESLSISFVFNILLIFASLIVLFRWMIWLDIDDILFLLLNQWWRFWSSIPLLSLWIWFTSILLQCFLLLLFSYFSQPCFSNSLLYLRLLDTFGILCQLLFFLESLFFLFQLCFGKFLHFLLLFFLFCFFICLFLFFKRCLLFELLFLL